MTTTIQPTREARRLHLSHLATTHRAPLTGLRPTGVRSRAAAFTPMTPDPSAAVKPHGEVRRQTRDS